MGVTLPLNCTGASSRWPDPKWSFLILPALHGQIRTLHLVSLTAYTAHALIMDYCVVQTRQSKPAGRLTFTLFTGKVFYINIQIYILWKLERNDPSLRGLTRLKSGEVKR